MSQASAMFNGRQLPAADQGRSAPRRVNPGFMGRPRATRDLADLDSDLVSVAQAVWPTGGELRQIFDVPPQEFPSWAKYRYGPGHALIFTNAGVVHAQTAGFGQAAQARLVRAAAVQYVQVGQLLLYGYLEISYAADGQTQQEIVEFNTVGWDLLQPALAELLLDVSVACPPPPVAAEAPEISAGTIDRLPMKYANGLRFYTLAPGERLLAMTFQPDIWIRRLFFFRHEVTPAIVLALTDRHVSLIEGRRAVGQKPSYGWTFTFMPRHGVTGMRSAAAPLGRLVNIDMLVDGTQTTYALELTTEVAAAWEAQWRAHDGQWVEDVSNAGAGG